MDAGWNRFRICIAALVLLAPGLGGCVATSGFSEDPLKPSDTSIAADRAVFWSTDIESCYHAGTCDKPKLDSRQAIRDYIVLGRMHVYRVEFSLLVRNLAGGNNLVSVGSDLTALLLNGLGATTGDAPTKAALAAASGGVLAANGAVDKDVFYSKTVPAIIAQMEANRAKAEATIFEGLKLGDDKYDLGRATHDLDLLNDAGSLTDAIGSITQAATTEKQSAQAEDWTTPYRNTPECETVDCKTIHAWLLKDPKNLAALAQWCADPKNVPPKYKDLPMPEALADTPGDALDLLRQQAITSLSIK